MHKKQLKTTQFERQSLQIHIPITVGIPTIAPPLHVGIVIQKEGQRQNCPLQAEDRRAQPAGELQYDDGVIFPDVRLEVAQEVRGPGEDEDGDGSLEDGREDGGHHVGTVQPGSTAAGGGGAAEHGSGDGDGVEKDEEGAGEGGDEAEGEGEEGAA
ncbi:sphingomyelin phosphodiesterase 3 [Striga asiatica]|uniref:Sphingomyelin phosphodiesterase 3 n=1 Tax=Striga asiatica TaxID=4170 RepID=A0A5A7Q4L2_STRAF|nr:sphingomyelin phosphodiesterase 3 [Striga asiatica]